MEILKMSFEERRKDLLEGVIGVSLEISGSWLVDTRKSAVCKSEFECGCFCAKTKWRLIRNAPRFTLSADD